MAWKKVIPRTFFICCVYLRLLKTIELSPILGGDFVGSKVTGYRTVTSKLQTGTKVVDTLV